MLTVSIIGAGRVGGALAIALERAGYAVRSIVYRGDRFLSMLQASLPSADFVQGSITFKKDTEILIIASGDPDIRAIAETISSGSGLPKFAFHTSGSLSSDELGALRKKGVLVGSLHPLAAVSDPVAGAERFRGAYFCIEGDAGAVEVGRKIVSDLGGQSFSIPTASKPLYHASAVMSAGHVVALLDAAIEMMQLCGLTENEARKILVPLAAGSVANLSETKPSTALTGPYARGDRSALERHLVAFDTAQIDSELRRIYLELALRSVEIAIKDGRNFTSLRESILIAKDRSR